MPSPSIESFGEKTIRLFERLYLLILDLLIRIAVLLNELEERISDFERKTFYPFFARRGIEMKDYTVLKIQISSALFLLLTTLFILNYIGLRRYVFTGSVLVLITLYLLYFSVKKEFREFNAYRDFFVFYISLAVILAVIKVKKPVVSIGFPFLHFFAVAILGTIAIYVYIGSRYSRDYTIGKVVSDKGIDLEVKLNYDITSNTKPQTVFLRKTMNAREGDSVKVRVNRGFLSLKGSTPVEIIGVEWS